METARAVGDGTKLDNEELGVLQRRLNEIVRRIDNGTISKDGVQQALQKIIEGKAEEMLAPCRRPHRSLPRPFVRPSHKERRRSRAPVKLRLPHSLERLGYMDALRKKHPDRTFPGKHPEDIMAEMWEAENIPRYSLNYGSTPVNTILNDPKPSKRDRMVIASTLQWLGTNCGREFLSRFIAAADLHV